MGFLDAPGRNSPVISEDATNPGMYFVNGTFAYKGDDRGTSVKNYGAKGDGVVDDTAAINTALAASQGRKLTFPKGKYLVSGNLMNFWGASVVGEGSIVRGGEEYFITPTNSTSLVQTSTLWANAGTGADTNDGLFSASPVKTVSKIYYQMLRRLTPEQANGGKWLVRLSGAFQGGQKFSDLPDFAFGLTFEGDALTAGDPVTSIAYNGDSSRAIGLWFDPGTRKVVVNKLKFTGFKVGFNGYGVLMKSAGNLEINDCWADNCDIGFAAIGNVNFNINTTKATNCGDGYRAQYSASGTFDHCTADTCTSTGFFISRNAVVHIDYCTISNNPLGLYIDNAARVHLMGANVKRNTLGVKAEGASEWINDLSILNNWNIGTADANTRDYQSFGVGRETRQYSQGTHNEYMMSSAMEVNATYATPQTVTGTTSNTTVYLGSGLGELPANWFTHPGKAIRVKVYGMATTTAAGRVRLYVTESDGSSITLLSDVTIPAGASSAAFEAEFKVWAITPTSQTTRGSIVGSGMSGASASTTSANMATRKLFRMYCLPGAAGDSYTFDNMEIFFAG